jgi:carbon monoxide dehydrogenase subunit G
MLHTADRLRSLAISAACAFALGLAGATIASAAAPADVEVKVQIVDDEIRTNVSFFVKAPRQRVWDVITDYERAPEYMRDVQSAKVVSRSGDTVRLMQKDQVRVGPFSMGIDTLRDVKHTAPVRTEAHLVSGSFKKYDSKMELVPEGGGTRVTYQSETVAGSALAGFASESMIRRATEERFRQLRAEIQRRELVAAQQ